MLLLFLQNKAKPNNRKAEEEEDEDHPGGCGEGVGEVGGYQALTYYWFRAIISHKRCEKGNGAA